MKKVRNTGIIVLVKGISMVLLGIVHIMAILIFQIIEVESQMSKQLEHEFILWFSLGGLFFIYIGIMDIYASRGVKKQMKWAWEISFISAVSSVIIAVTGIAVFKEGPPFFILFVGLAELIPLLLIRKLFNKKLVRFPGEKTL